MAFVSTFSLNLIEFHEDSPKQKITLGAPLQI
jgi:hypothetical protein